MCIRDSFTPDPAEISKAVEEQLDTMSAQLAQNNLTLDDYCKFSNSTLEQLREDVRPGADEAVRIKALVLRVVQAEELHAHEEDVAQALSEICRCLLYTSLVLCDLDSDLCDAVFFLYVFNVHCGTFLLCGAAYKRP